MADKGDKYIIEIADTSHITQDDGLKRQIYRIKGFNTLILDDYALSKLTELEKATVNIDKAYDNGYREADEIHVGDEVRVDDYENNVGVITCVEIDGYRIMDYNGDVDFYGNHYTFEKTGRHFEQITDLLKAMRDEQK